MNPQLRNLLLSLLLCLVGCTPVPSPKIEGTSATLSPKPATITCRIATFNIQNFGKAKAGKPEVLAALAAIIRKYDIVAVQEISDATGQVPQNLLTTINADGS